IPSRLVAGACQGTARRADPRRRPVHRQQPSGLHGPLPALAQRHRVKAGTLAGRLVGRKPAAGGSSLGRSLRPCRAPFLGELMMALLPDPAKAALPTLIGFLLETV